MEKKKLRLPLNKGLFNSFKQSIQSLFVNVCKWFLKMVWSMKWLLFAFMLIIFVAYFILKYLQLTSDIGICYLLSAISQGLAAILAIILSATLVAGQLASRYSPQLLKNAFKSSTIVYILIFVVGIVFPLVILANMDMMASSILVKISLIWASACLILLIPYFLSLKEWLDPKNLIEGLYWKAFKKLRNKKDKLPEEASTIGEAAISLYSAKNYVGYGNGLKKLTQLVKDISLSSEKVLERKEDVEEERQEELVVEIPQVVRQLIDMLRHIRISVEDDPVATGKVIEALGECAIVVQDLDVNKEIIDGLEEAVDGAIECGREVPCKQIAFLLGGIGGKAAAKAQPTTARRLLRVLGRMSSLSLDNSWDKAARQVIIAIHSVGKIGIDRVDEARELEGVCREAITQLRLSYGEAMEKGRFNTAGEAAWRLGNLGGKAIGELFSITQNYKTDLENNKVSEDLRKVFKDNEYPLSIAAKILTVANNEWTIKDGEKEYTVRESDNQLNIYKKGLEAPTKGAIFGMGKIAEKAIELNKEPLTREAIERLTCYGMETAGQFPEEVAISCLKWLTTIGSSVFNVYENLAQKVIEGIGAIGGEGCVKQCNEVLEQAITSLISLSEKINRTKPHLASLMAAQLWKFGAYAMRYLPEKRASIKKGLDDIKNQIGEEALESGFNDVKRWAYRPPGLFEFWDYYYMIEGDMAGWNSGLV